MFPQRGVLMKKPRQKYTREFKVEAVRMVTEQGLSIAQVSRDLGVSANMLSRWKKQFGEDPGFAFPGKGKLKPQDEELRRLRRENAILRQERDFLKKATAFFAKESK
jgi:transposase